jgi:hypothetical protein
MRNLLLILACMSLFSSLYAGDNDKSFTPIFVQDKSTGEYYYEEVVTATGAGKEELYNRAKKWIVANMKTADNNIIFDDNGHTIVNATGIVLDKKNFFTVIIQEGVMSFKFHVWCKDGRLKLRVDNIIYNVVLNHRSNTFSPHTWTYGDLNNNRVGNNLKEQGNEKAAALIAMFKESVINNSDVKDNW